MQINIFYLNKNKKKKIEKKLVQRLVLYVLKKEGRKFNSINIIIADDDYLKELNRKYLKRGRKTNVISFNLGDTGEIYISINQAYDRKTLLFFLIHGLLHLCGYDHKNKKEERFLADKCEGYLKEGLRKF